MWVKTRVLTRLLTGEAPIHRGVQNIPFGFPDANNLVLECTEAIHPPLQTLAGRTANSSSTMFNQLA